MKDIVVSLNKLSEGKSATSAGRTVETLLDFLMVPYCSDIIGKSLSRASTPALTPVILDRRAPRLRGEDETACKPMPFCSRLRLTPGVVPAELDPFR